MEVLIQNLYDISWQQMVMWAVGGLLIYLAIAKEMEPSLLGFPLSDVLPSLDFNVLLMIAGTMGLVALCFPKVNGLFNVSLPFLCR